MVNKGNGVTKPPSKIEEFFSTYFSFCGISESPIIYQRWAALSLLSVAIGRRTFFKLGHVTIYPNLYLMLIGDPAVRKSYSIGITKKILKGAGFKNFSAERTTAEKFIHDLAESGADSFFEESQIFVAADEFTDFIGEKNFSFISLLTKIFDSPESYEYRLKNSKSVEVHAPCINILGGNTHAGFQYAFPPEILHTGLLSRLLLIYSRKVKQKITIPKEGPEEDKLKLIALVQSLKNFYSGEVKASPPAYDAFHEIYQKFDGLDDGRFVHYNGRRHTHLIKIALCLAAIELSYTIREEHVVWANTLLSSIEDKFPQALGEFGKSKNSEIAGKLMNFLRASDVPLTIPELFKGVSSDLNDVQEMQKILINLQTAEKITRAGAGYAVCRKYMEALPFTDFSLLSIDERPRTKQDVLKEMEELQKSLEEGNVAKAAVKGVEIPGLEKGL